PFGLESNATASPVPDERILMARILVVEDDADIREILRDQLESAGHDVVEAANGKAGLLEIRRRNCDLVITDIYMPEKDGLELINEMHAADHPPPVIAISGGGDRDLALRMLTLSPVLGAKAVLAKPFTEGELLQTVEAVLKSMNWRH